MSSRGKKKKEYNESKYLWEEFQKYTKSFNSYQMTGTKEE